ncbi:hypothetical protein BDW62DRAFT_216437 [Aspergillus aurantiobrunneus]
MDRPTHVIDPDGEVIIILRNADSPFAEPSKNMIAYGFNNTVPEPNNNIRDTAEEIDHPEECMETPKSTLRGKKKKKKGNKKVQAPLEPISLPIEEPPAVTDEPAAAEEPHAVTDEPPAVTDEPAAAEGPAGAGINEQQEEVCFRIQVSAKHLILASPVFKKILTGGWKESVTYLQKGSVEITAESWDVEALLILLRIIHCQYYQIPRKLTLEMLAKVALLADYYDCREAVDILGHIWINALEENVPLTYCRDLILWLWVSCFFQLHAQFKEATSTAMSWSNNRIDSLGLPIPDDVIRSMDDRRQGAIAGLVLRLHETRDELLSGSRGCTFECSSIMYGALTKQMQSNALLWPEPAVPFPNLNYSILVQRVLSFTSPEWYGPSYHYSRYQHSCLHSSFKSLFGGLNHTIEGLSLDSLVHG